FGVMRFSSEVGPAIGNESEEINCHQLDPLVRCQMALRNVERGVPMDLPKIISVDDHVIEPPDLFQRYLPRRYVADAPRVDSVRGRLGAVDDHKQQFVHDDEAPFVSVWRYDRLSWPYPATFVAAALKNSGRQFGFVHFDDMPAACYEP